MNYFAGFFLNLCIILFKYCENYGNLLKNDYDFTA
jgi:hypothetical protein